jgi:hypothetical protein
MKQESALTRMTMTQQIFHEADKLRYPERHMLTENSYLKFEFDQMCTWCADHYEWNKQLEYDPRTDRYYKTTAEPIK